MISYDNYWLKCIWLKELQIATVSCMGDWLGVRHGGGEFAGCVFCTMEHKTNLNTHLHEMVFQFDSLWETLRSCQGYISLTVLNLQKSVFLYVASSKTP